MRFAGPERRRMPRYYVTVPVEFDGGTGTTKDVNESGVRFEIDQPLAPDQSVTLRLVFRDFQGGDPWRQFRQLVSPVSLADPNAPGATLDVIA